MKLIKYLNEISAKEKEIRLKYKDTPVKDIPVEDLWVSMMQGNTKLHKSIKTFNLPAVQSCPDSKTCAKNCYALKSEKGRFGKVARPSRERNFRLAKENLELLKRLILKHLKKGDIVRIHESGDMFSQEYLDMWTEIIKERPDVLFYTYTKTEQRFNWSIIKRLPNFNLVSSMINGKLNFGPEKEITIMAKELGAFVCPCKKGNKVVCGVDCKVCMTPGNERVVFIQH